MNGPWIKVVHGQGGKAGYVIAVIPPGGDVPVAAGSPVRTGVTLVVGNAGLVSGDGQAEEWEAHLWPVAGGAGMAVWQSVEAVTAASREGLRDKLQKRADKGPWWEAA